jgi:hypothetical protein
MIKIKFIFIFFLGCSIDGKIKNHGEQEIDINKHEEYSNRNNNTSDEVLLLNKQRYNVIELTKNKYQKYTNSSQNTIANCFKSIFEKIKNGIEERNKIIPNINFYKKFLKISKENSYLEKGTWHKLDKRIKENLKMMKRLGLSLENFESILENVAKVPILIQKIKNFEQRLLSLDFEDYENIDQSIIDLAKDFTDYCSSISILSQIFNDLKNENGEIIFSSQNNKEEKKIEIEYAQTIKDWNCFIQKSTNNIDFGLNHISPMISSGDNLISYLNEEKFKSLKKLIGWKDFEGIKEEDLKDINNENKDEYVVPGGILYTLMENEKLEKGKWDSIFGIKDKEKSILYIIYKMTEFIRVIKNLEKKINSNSNFKDHDKEKIILEEFSNLGKDEIEKIATCMGDLKKVLFSIEKFYIRGKDYKGLQYAGKWISKDNFKQISEKDFKNTVNVLDYLGSYILGIYSKFEVKTFINYSEFFSGGKYWIHESEQERKERRSKNSQNILFASMIVAVLFGNLSSMLTGGGLGVGAIGVFLVVQVLLQSTKHIYDGNIISNLSFQERNEASPLIMT